MPPKDHRRNDNLRSTDAADVMRRAVELIRTLDTQDARDLADDLACVHEQAREIHGWITMWPAVGGGHRPIFNPGKIKPSYGNDLDSVLDIYPVHTLALEGAGRTMLPSGAIAAKQAPAPELPARAAMPSEADIDAFLGEYVVECDDGTYTPTGRERFIIKDAVIGLLAEHESRLNVARCTAAPAHQGTPKTP